jgi:hypothetical protein
MGDASLGLVQENIPDVLEMLYRPMVKTNTWHPAAEDRGL